MTRRIDVRVVRRLIEGALASWVVISLMACSGVDLVRPDSDFLPFVHLDGAQFAGASGILDGLAADDTQPSLRVGDAALFGVEFRRGARVERQLVRIEVAQLGSTTLFGDKVVRRRNVATATITNKETGVERRYRMREAGFALTRFDAAGKELSRSRPVLYEEPLCVGWWPYTRSDLPAISRDTDLAFALTMTLQDLASDDPTLRELLFQLVDAPSVLSVITNLGVRASLNWQDRGERPFVHASLPTGRPVRIASLELGINGAPALWADLLVTEPRGAMTVCGGLVGAVARHPTDPGRMAVMRLLATRRGPAE